jgi:hypothetical protein
VSRVDITIRAAAGVTVVGLAGIAGAISYSHMTELAHAHGETGWRARMFPLSVDGIEIVASLVLLADKRAGCRSGVLPWAALIAGTGASFAANVAVGGSDWIGRAVSGWPAFALLIAVKLLFGLLDHPPAKPFDELVPVPDRLAEPGTAPTDGDTDQDRADDGDDGPGDEDKTDRDGDYADALANNFGRPPVGPAPNDGRGSVLLETPDVSALLPAARTARATLARNGQALTREALARQLRADGHAASTPACRHCSRHSLPSRPHPTRQPIQRRSR